MEGALDGVKILGFTHFAQGPFALQLLGDLGADVINVERPGKGDFNRSFHQREDMGGESPIFLALNRNKRSLAIDLKTEEGKKIIKELVRDTDVVVTNYRAGVLEHLGLGYEALRKINPALVYCEALGYGESGPYIHLPGQDIIGQAISGLVTMVGRDLDGMPESVGIYEVDIYSSMVIVVAVTTALYHARQTGQGQRVAVDLLSSAIHLQSQEFSYYLNTGELPKRAHNHSGHTLQPAPYGIYRTSDGFMVLSTNAGDRPELLEAILNVDTLMPLMGSEEKNMRNREKIFGIVQEKIKEKPTQYWLDQFNANGIWCGKVNTYENLKTDPQVLHNGIIQHIPHPRAGAYQAIGTPIYYSETPPTIRRTAPALGEHNEEILTALGYSAGDIESLREKGVI
ncbi:MAG: CoA transferase [Clostridiales bacterium]|nr:CoA transferase [Clostridiales bacterium]